MPLKIQIKVGQKIIINGAVLENISQRTTSLLVKNEASILREDDILTAEEANTPASRLYYSLQCLYLFPQATERYLPVFKELSASYVDAAPSSKTIIETILGLVEEHQCYTALKKAQELIVHEGKVLSDAQQRISEKLRSAPDTGEPASDGGLGTDAGGPAHEGEPGS